LTGSLGDFNLLRRPKDRNRDGADPNEVFLFNEAINKLDLVELPLHDRHYTWTNKQFPLSWKDWNGSSLQILGLLNSPIPWSDPLLWKHLIIGLVWLKSAQQFPKAKSSDLKIIGLVIMTSSKWWSVGGKG